ncbi:MULTISPECIES: bifunctional diguanylate cyclase/phosphodiesterase [unclassified Methylophilus]|uniref:putative bifunctional diguanylate cyclase/phosphodiesterase n=1 Tax=unclassified Methylophilus TaxID=2630143 RepID=UPI002100D76A|nr:MULTISPECIES: EAL domain-containing protein [unclassified Methylophilus]
MSAAKRRDSKLAILFFDIDHFKRVNDTLGHEVGDQLLKVMSKKLQMCIRASDTLSRQGGDEFVVLLPELNDDTVPAEIAQKILSAIKDPINIANHELYITASIGIAVYPDDGDSVDVLTRHADAAMYHAKNSGRNNYQFFTKEMSARVAAQLTMENSLQKAISNNELLLFYQPKVSIKTGKIIGAEALIRWSHPEWGLMMPDRFIKIAEESGLIKGIGHWVLREACTQNKKWQDAGLPEIPIAINVSVVELHHAHFTQEVMKVLLQTGLQPYNLELEVTESVAFQSEATVIHDLNKLKEMGVRLSVDDFGTGYSSLSYLKLLPVNTIKIDKSFIRDIQIDINDAAIVTAIIKMSQSLGLTVIAEGVETQAQLEFLKSHDCDEMQGYLFSRPLPADEFEALLAQQ